MEKKLRTLLIIFLLTGIIVVSLISVNQLVIATRIYYKATYRGDLIDIETVIEKSELFNYQEYCKYQDCSGEVYNLSNSDNYYHIDRDLLETIKNNIEDDQGQFHLYPFYTHTLKYIIEVNQQTLLYFTYNNFSIIKAEYANYSEIFKAKDCFDSVYREEGCYMNFTQIPNTPDLSSTIAINNSTLVKMSLEYDHNYGFGIGVTSIRIEQYLCYNINLELIFVYIPMVVLLLA